MNNLFLSTQIECQFYFTEKKNFQFHSAFILYINYCYITAGTSHEERLLCVWRINERSQFI